MAACEICGKKIGIGNQAYMAIPNSNKYLNICKACDDQMYNLYHPTEEHFEQAKQYLSPYMSRSDIKPEVRDYIASLCDDASNKLGARRKMSEDILKQADVRKEIEQRKVEQRQEALFNKSDNMRDFMMTTGNTFEGYRIVKYITIVTGEAVIGTGLLSEIGADVTDSLGGNSILLEEKFSFAESDSINILKEKALNVGANALLAVQFNITTLSKRNTIIAVASGTAVRVEKLE